MKSYDARVITAVTRWRGATLMRLCDDLGIAQTVQGRVREVDLRDLMTLVLVRRLMDDHGLRREEAILLALQVKHTDWLDIVAAERQAWLFARRDETGAAKWVVTIANSNEEAAQLLIDSGGGDSGWVVVSLSAIARRVFMEEMAAIKAEPKTKVTA